MIDMVHTKVLMFNTMMGHPFTLFIQELQLNQVIVLI